MPEAVLLQEELEESKATISKLRQELTSSESAQGANAAQLELLQESVQALQERCESKAGIEAECACLRESLGEKSHDLTKCREDLLELQTVSCVYFTFRFLTSDT